MSEFIDINISEWRGAIPAGHDLVIHERGGDPEDGAVLFGFDEVVYFRDHFKNPAYSFIVLPDLIGLRSVKPGANGVARSKAAR